MVQFQDGSFFSIANTGINTENSKDCHKDESATKLLDLLNQEKKDHLYQDEDFLKQFNTKNYYMKAEEDDKLSGLNMKNSLDVGIEPVYNLLSTPNQKSLSYGAFDELDKSLQKCNTWQCAAKDQVNETNYPPLFFSNKKFSSLIKTTPVENDVSGVISDSLTTSNSFENDKTKFSMKPIATYDDNTSSSGILCIEKNKSSQLKLSASAPPFNNQSLQSAFPTTSEEECIPLDDFFSKHSTKSNLWKSTSIYDLSSHKKNYLMRPLSNSYTNSSESLLPISNSPTLVLENTIYVENFPKFWTMACFYKIFSLYGQIINCYICDASKDTQTSSKCVIQYDNPESPERAYNHLNGIFIEENKKLVITCNKLSQGFKELNDPTNDKIINSTNGSSPIKDFSLMKSQGALDPVTSDLVRNYNSFTNEINADGLNFSHNSFHNNGGATNELASGCNFVYNNNDFLYRKSPKYQNTDLCKRLSPRRFMNRPSEVHDASSCKDYSGKSSTILYPNDMTFNTMTEKTNPSSFQSKEFIDISQNTLKKNQFDYVTSKDIFLSNNSYKKVEQEFSTYENAAKDVNLEQCNSSEQLVKVRKTPDFSSSHIQSNRSILAENNLFVFHIPPGWKEAEFEKVFSQFGPIRCLRFPKDDTTPWGHRGYGFICYHFHEHACLAIQKMHGKQVEVGRRLKVEFKKPCYSRLHHDSNNDRNPARNSNESNLFIL